MIRNNDIIQGYTVLMVANGMVLAHSKTAPDPYVVWHIAENGNDVYGGNYQSSKEDAEWDFCMKAFPWFEDNAPIAMIEDEVDKTQKTLKYLLQGARECIVGAAAKVDELVKEHARLMGKEKAPQDERAEHNKSVFVYKPDGSIDSCSEKQLYPVFRKDDKGFWLNETLLRWVEGLSLSSSDDNDGTFRLDLKLIVRL